MADKPEIDDYDDFDTNLDDTLDDTDGDMDGIISKSKKNPLTRRQIDNLLEKKRLERELRDSYEDFDDDDLGEEYDEID